MKYGQIVAAIDIGSEKIVAALANISAQGDINLIALVEKQSKGVKKGGIANIALVKHTVNAVLDELEADGSYQIHSIISSISGINIVGHNADGRIVIKSNHITKHNVLQAAMIARDVAVQEGRHLLHLLKQDIIVDNQHGIDDPIGLIGETLELHAHAITTTQTHYQNLLQVFSERDVDVESVVSAGLASALAVTMPEEKKLGVCVLDIGAGTTEITIIANNVVKHSEVIQIGGEAITSDVAFFMRSTTETADWAKQQVAIDFDYPLSDTLEIPGLSEASRSYPKYEIAEVIRDRCEDLIHIVMQKINRAGFESAFPAGFVICGGGAQLLGIETLLMHQSQLPVRRGEVELTINGKTVKACRYATLMGLFMCAYEEDYSSALTQRRKKGIIKSIVTSAKTVVQRLRQYF
ncbi:cell division protein FtsA [Ostreibacterium oceani]|uniref:Cell division protein FtsA n=1 Tax=Ostreibacterium oceani TaxID=2654998 RepID=A0A6N7EYQ1_9GAMM|nr:cell division protein FtsA [Ostreibacterium oceani]MPV86277.1 cell division protein FtsA [Ostreibacterium oceani]